MPDNFFLKRLLCAINYSKLCRLVNLVEHRHCPIETHNRVVRNEWGKKHRWVNKSNKGLSAISKTEEAIICVLRNCTRDTAFDGCIPQPYNQTNVIVERIIDLRSEGLTSSPGSVSLLPICRTRGLSTNWPSMSFGVALQWANWAWWHSFSQEKGPHLPRGLGSTSPHWQYCEKLDIKHLGGPGSLGAKELAGIS